jgi:hypothetical protein
MRDPSLDDLNNIWPDLAQLRGQLADALNRIQSLEGNQRGILASIRMLDRLRPTCVICHDETADRQTPRGPACSDCVGEPKPDTGPYSPFGLADQAIGLFLEYRDQHGYAETDARHAAALEVAEGMATFDDPGPVTPSPWSHPEPPRADDADEPTNRDIEPDPADWHDGPDPEPSS